MNHIAMDYMYIHLSNPYIMLPYSRHNMLHVYYFH